ncbi:MAG: hypothetical protein ACOCX1_00160 [Fimbriimonadaceae bacterium]
MWYGLSRNQGELTLLAVLVAGAGIGYQLLGPKVGQTFQVGYLSMNPGGMVLAWRGGRVEEISWPEIKDLKIWHGAPRPVPQGYLARSTELELKGHSGNLVRPFELNEDQAAMALEVIRRNLEKHGEANLEHGEGLRTTSEPVLEARVWTPGDAPYLTPASATSIGVVGAILLLSGLTSEAVGLSIGGSMILVMLAILGGQDYRSATRQNQSPCRLYVEPHGLSVEAPGEMLALSWDEFVKVEHVIWSKEVRFQFIRGGEVKKLRLHFVERDEMEPILRELEARS